MPHSERAVTSNEAQKLIRDLNEHLAREYAEFMNIAGELEEHAPEELQRALIIAKQIDYLGGMPIAQPKSVHLTESNREMLQADLNNETDTIRNYRLRIRQCESMGEYAMAEQIRGILVQEQDHQIALATALGIDVLKDQVTKAEAAG